MGEINRKYVDINELISLSKNAFRKLYDGSNIQNEQVKFECKIERLDMHIMLYMAFIVDNKEYKYEVNSYIHNL